ncbi:glycine-rich RNA-binding, putative [Babesia ovis]|uniref:Glycine-rich RNA-binding, putative n=1 Tax=Babesia ovis TaxID=5869 RepID=A0A9W5TAK4_BABOV|nr:glycine-rich RNA-binding, putative [Babesia ovis]
MSIEPFIGSRITITSNADIRYEGLLYDLNTEDGVVVLQNVRCFGTENRRPHGEVPPSNKLHDFMVFKGEDIKDLGVCEVEKEDAPKPSGYNVHDQHTSQAPYPLGMPTAMPQDFNSMAGIAQPPNRYMVMNQMPQSTVAQPPMPGFYMGGLPTPTMLPSPIVASNVGHQQAGAYDPRNIPMPSQPRVQEYFTSAPQPNPTPHTGEPIMPPKISKGIGTSTIPMYDNAGSPRIPTGDLDKFDLAEFDFGPDPFSETNALPHGTNKILQPFDHQSQHREKREIGTLSPKLKVPTKPSGGDKGTKAPHAQAPSNTLGNQRRSGQSQTKSEPRNQVDLPSNHSGAPVANGDLRPFYDKKTSFFDNLSSDIHTDRRTKKEERQRQRDINVDTFGIKTVRRSHNTNGRGRGDRRRTDRPHHGDKKNSSESDKGNDKDDKGTAKTSKPTADLAKDPKDIEA